MRGVRGAVLQGALAALDETWATCGWTKSSDTTISEQALRELPVLVV